MKKLLFGVLISLLLLGCASADEANLIQNGGFEDVNASGSPSSWYTVSYAEAAGNTLFEITDEQAHSGAYSAKIVNANLNDARFVAYVNVQPESVYRISGYILVAEMDDAGAGANFGLEGATAKSAGVYDTDGQWKYVEWYGETDTGQTTVEIGVRVGGYSAESRGIAYFDDISVEKVDAIPQNVYADLWFNYASNDSSIASQAMDEEAGSHKSTALFIVLGLLFLGLTAFSARYLLADSELKPAQGRAFMGAFALLLTAAFALRLILAGSIYGYEVDIGCFSAWSGRMAAVGPLNFYAPDYFCDYPPGYMLLLWPIGQINAALGYSQTAGTLIMLKIIPILCDMFIAMLLFQYAKKRIPVKAAAFVSLMFAFNPAVLVTGAAWGQVDSLLALLLMIAAMQASQKKWRVALPVYFLAVLVKPQALLFGPVALVWLIAALLFDLRETRKAQWKQLWQGALFSVLAAAVVVLPFQIRQADPLWLWKLYRQTLSSYNYAVLNTANLSFLLGGNWSPLTADVGAVRTLSAFLPVGTGLLLVSLGLWKLGVTQGFKGLGARFAALWLGLKHKQTGGDDSRKLILAAFCAVFGLAFLISAFWPSTFLLYGTMWMVFTYAAVLLLIIVERKAAALPFYMALMLIGVYVLGIKIHERYLVEACALLPLAYLGTRDRRLLWLCAGLSATMFVNIAIVLDNSILYGASMGHLNSDSATVNVLVCILNLILCGYAAYIAFTGLKPSAAMRKPSFKPFAGEESHRERLLRPGDAKLRLKARDVLIMGVTFAVYCAVAFANLGSAKAPQTAFVSGSAEDQVVFELPENTTFKLLYYAGVSYHNFSVSVSADGETWSDKTLCRMRQGLCYRWMYATTALSNELDTEDFAADSEANIVWFTGKYLRVNAEFAGLNLWEIVLRDVNGDRIPVTLISYAYPENALQPATPENLIDEQDTITGEPGWFNGTYFDEIYHARTAYEHLHGQTPYETTHPPLGKEIISVGIAVFGMTPFGWRFMGALFGALMLPAIYLFGMQLTGKRKLAAFGMMLMSLDLMHFTQTRIATIDSFPTLFIILSYLCMARYILSDPFAVSGGKPRVITKAYLKSLVPLLLSGVFIGCAIASKWIGLYAGAGLFVLFFYAVYRQFRSGLAAYDINTETLSQKEKDRVIAARMLTLKRIFATFAFCVLFFLVIPAAIYYLSYIPYLSPTGPVTLQRIIRAQQGMLSYHSTPGLGMDHPFYSPWWQWPLILKPMWYAKDAYAASGFGANIVCLGNPAVFYLGALSMAAVFVMLMQKYVRGNGDRQSRGDYPALAILAISFLAQYLPWVLVPRSMFIYHYFASLPFIILATMLVAGYIRSEKLKNWLMISLLTAALILFIMFYPYASGLTVSSGYMHFLRWFPNLPV